MWKKIKQFKRLWDLSSKDAEYLKAIEGLTKEDIQAIPESGDGKAVFIPLMSESQRDEYLREQEPKLGKFYKKVKELIK
jgi:hypothetical protein